MFLAACVVLTQSRGGGLAPACVGVYYWLKSGRKHGVSVVSTLALVGILLFAPAACFERMATMNADEGSAKGRVTAWNALVRVAASNPLTGVGTRNFPYLFRAYMPADEAAGGQLTSHSIYCLILGELGLPSLALLHFFIVWNLTTNRTVFREARARWGDASPAHARLLTAASASPVAYAIAGAFLGQLYTPHWYALPTFLTAARPFVRVETESAVTIDHQAEVSSPARTPAVGKWQAAHRGPAFGHNALHTSPRLRTLPGHRPEGTRS